MHNWALFTRPSLAKKVAPLHASSTSQMPQLKNALIMGSAATRKTVLFLVDILRTEAISVLLPITRATTIVDVKNGKTATREVLLLQRQTSGGSRSRPSVNLHQQWRQRAFAARKIFVLEVSN